MLFRKLAKAFKVTDQAYLNTLSRAGSIGLHMVSGIAVGTGIGYFLDKWLDTDPWMTGIFMIIGIVAGFKNVYLDTKRLVASQKQEDDKYFSQSGQNSDGKKTDRK